MLTEIYLSFLLFRMIIAEFEARYVLLKRQFYDSSIPLPFILQDANFVMMYY